MKRTERQRFWSKVHTPPQPCWEWQGHLNDRGYGKFNRDGEKARVAAHRYAFEMAYGPIPEGHVVRHTCDNPACVNPAHLIDGTQTENMQDAVARKRIASGARNGRTTLTEEDVAYIRSNPRGMTLKLMATRYRMSEAAIHYIRKGRSWKMVGAAGIEPASAPCDDAAKPLS